MDTLVIILIVLVVVLIGVGVLLLVQRNRSQRLKDRFGPEYHRALDESDSRLEAERELVEREQHRQAFELRELDPGIRQHYEEEWRGLQQRFVDEPRDAVLDADRLLIDVMRDRGYPIEDFERRAADISVDHPTVVDDYRTAHAIALRVYEDRADTEDLRQAVIHYRSLFDDLLNGRSARE